MFNIVKSKLQSAFFSFCIFTRVPAHITADSRRCHWPQAARDNMISRRLTVLRVRPDDYDAGRSFHDDLFESYRSCETGVICTTPMRAKSFPRSVPTSAASRALTTIHSGRSACAFVCFNNYASRAGTYCCDRFDEKPASRTGSRSTRGDKRVQSITVVHKVLGEHKSNS